MKLRYEELLDYVEPPELPAEPLSPASQERILELTMKKINESKPRRKIGKPIRWLTAAAVLLLLLCGTALAAVQYGWFGFDRIFGEKAELVEEGVTAYEPREESPATLPTYTEEEQAMIEEGTMMVPEQAELEDTGVSASTEDFQFTLEQMLAGEDVLFATLRVNARSEEAEAVLANTAADVETENPFSTENRFRLSVTNYAEGSLREKEMNNGSMGMTPLSVSGSVGYFLVSNVGGQFAEGDPILFRLLSNGQNFDLFKVPLGPLMEEKAVVELDTSVYAGKGYQHETMTVTPISLEINGTYTESPDQSCPVVAVKLRDGTRFELCNFENGLQKAPYGQYGSLSWGNIGTGRDEGAIIRETWAFSKAIDLGEIDVITVDGVDYTLK